MSRPASPQFVETAQGDWSWTWKTHEGFQPEYVITAGGHGAQWQCFGCCERGGVATYEEAKPAFQRHVLDAHCVEHEYELEWLREVERWQVRSRYDRAGWTDPLTVDLDDPESQDHADQLARDYAARPRGGT